MTARTKTRVSDEITHIEELIGDLEKRLRRLNNSARGEASGAGGDINEFVSEALDRIRRRVRESAGEVTEQVADRALKAGSDAYQRMAEEFEYHPLATLAVAAGIGFLFGLSKR